MSCLEGEGMGENGCDMGRTAHTAPAVPDGKEVRGSETARNPPDLGSTRSDRATR